ncbi:MAG: nascent polypeptide-associated complex protein [Archaeoglobi archaeon]|nr:nascent polypeptide-associated complex protein [Candidatus Mnemosynella sp.]
MNPRAMMKMMKQMGIEMEEMTDVEKVIIVRKNSELIITNPEVLVISAKGSKSFQITGTVEEVQKLQISEEDIKLVMEQTGADEETARKALEETKGDLAEAILKLME